MRSCSVNNASDLKRQEAGKPVHAVLNGTEKEKHLRAGFALLLNPSALCADTVTPHSSFLISHFLLRDILRFYGTHKLSICGAGREPLLQRGIDREGDLLLIFRGFQQRGLLGV